MTTPEAKLQRWRTTFAVIWSIIGGLVLLAVAGWVFVRISGALAPFIVAFLIVFLLQGSVNFFERRGLARIWAVAVCFLIGFLILSLIGVFVLPAAGRQIAELGERVPGYMDSAEKIVIQLQQQFSEVVVPDWLSTTVESVVNSLSSVALQAGEVVAQGIVTAGSGVATSVFNLFLALVIAFWTLKDLPQIRKELRVLAGDKYEEDLDNLLGTVVHVVGGYLRGQSIVCLLTGVIVWVGLSIIGVPYALVLGILAFILNFVPYIGPIVTGIIAAVVAAFVSPLAALLAIVIVIAAQQLTDLFITPRVMSDQVDLHPTLVVFSLLIGGTLYGLWGMIFAIPVAATAKGLFVYYYERKTNKSISSEDGALFRSVPCEDGEDECEETESTIDETEDPKGST